MWFKKKEVPANFGEPANGLRDPETKPKGFQIGDRVIVVRFPNDGENTVSEFECVYGRIGEIVEIPPKKDTGYDYTVRFAGWNDGWNLDEFSLAGDCYGLFNYQLRRVSKRDEQ